MRLKLVITDEKGRKLITAKKGEESDKIVFNIESYHEKLTLQNDQLTARAAILLTSIQELL